MPDDDVVQLNVGGTNYSTTRLTLDKEKGSILSRIAQNDPSVYGEAIIELSPTSVFIDRDGQLFAYVLHYLRNGKLSLPEGFRENSRLRDEAEFYQLNGLQEQIEGILLNLQSLRPKLTNGGLSYVNSETGGYITLGYRGTFAFGRDGQADVKFRKLHRILVCGRATLCREVFGETLNESRDPGGADDGERYTSRLYLKHQCLERACDTMAEKGFKLVATCCSGANGLAAANHPIVAGSITGNSQSDLINHRNCGDYEEQRWAHYTEYVFFREPQTGFCTPSPRDL